MTRILKQWRHDFSGKHLRDGYFMDFMWCLCGGQNSWFCKASLRICYVSLFECKGPWMLKTYKHDFSGKHLCNGYCMDIMWCLCVEVKIHGFLKLL